MDFERLYIPPKRNLLWASDLLSLKVERWPGWIWWCAFVGLQSFEICEIWVVISNPYLLNRWCYGDATCTLPPVYNGNTPLVLWNWQRLVLEHWQNEATHISLTKMMVVMWDSYQNVTLANSYAFSNDIHIYIPEYGRTSVRCASRKIISKDVLQGWSPTLPSFINCVSCHWD